MDDIINKIKLKIQSSPDNQHIFITTEEWDYLFNNITEFIEKTNIDIPEYNTPDQSPLVFKNYKIYKK